MWCRYIDQQVGLAGKSWLFDLEFNNSGRQEWYATKWFSEKECSACLVLWCRNASNSPSCKFRSSKRRQSLRSGKLIKFSFAQRYCSEKIALYGVLLSKWELVWGLGLVVDTPKILHLVDLDQCDKNCPEARFQIRVTTYFMKTGLYLAIISRPSIQVVGTTFGPGAWQNMPFGEPEGLPGQQSLSKRLTILLWKWQRDLKCWKVSPTRCRKEISLCPIRIRRKVALYCGIYGTVKADFADAPRATLFISGGPLLLPFSSSSLYLYWEMTVP